MVCKVDVENCPDVAEGECIVLCQDSGASNGGDGDGVGAGFSPSNEGVNKIVAMDDNLLWTASGSSCIRRWKVPARRMARALTSTSVIGTATTPTAVSLGVGVLGGGICSSLPSRH